jgi:hypothetical protein
MYMVYGTYMVPCLRGKYIQKTNEITHPIDALDEDYFILILVVCHVLIETTTKSLSGF